MRYLYLLQKPMKKIFTTIVLLSAINSFAQNSFFVQLIGGVGTTGTTGNIKNNNLDVIWSKQLGSFVTTDAALMVGYEHNGWSLATGISYLQTGYTEHYMYEEFYDVEVKNTEHFYHVIVPLTLARKWRLNERFYFNPAIGGAISYNYSIKETGSENDMNNVYHSYNTTLSTQLFDYNFQRTTFWCTLQAPFGYQLNKQLAITAGPDVEYMLTAMEKSGGSYSANHQNMKNYALLFNAGLVWHFNKRTNDVHQ